MQAISAFTMVMPLESWVVSQKGPSVWRGCNFRQEMQHKQTFDQSAAISALASLANSGNLDSGGGVSAAICACEPASQGQFTLAPRWRWWQHHAVSVAVAAWFSKVHEWLLPCPRFGLAAGVTSKADDFGRRPCRYHVALSH